MKKSTVIFLCLGSLIIGAVASYFVLRSSSAISFDQSSDADIVASFKAQSAKKVMGFQNALVLESAHAVVEDPVIKAHFVEKVHADSIRNEYMRYNTGTFSWLRGRLLTGDNDKLEGYYIPKVLIDTMFKRYKDCSGIRLWLAKENGNSKRVFTFVIVATHPSPAAANTTAASQPVSDYDSADDLHFNYVATCPQVCNP